MEKSQKIISKHEENADIVGKNSNTTLVTKQELNTYFIEIGIELFDMGTPGFYRVKNTNLHTLLKEIDAYLFLDEDDLFLQKDDLFALIDEFLDLYDKDRVMGFREREGFSDFIKLLKKLDGKDIDFKNLIQKVKIRIKPLLFWFNDHYLERMKSVLIRILGNEVPVIEDFVKIKKITCSLACEILDKGYSKFYAFDLFLKLSNGMINIQELMENINVKTNKYTIYFKLIISGRDASEKIIHSLFNNSKFRALECLPFKKEKIACPKKEIEGVIKNFLFCGEDPLPGYVKTKFYNFIALEVDSLDAHSAIRVAQTELLFLLDLATYEYHKTTITLHYSVLTELEGSSEVNLFPREEQIQGYKRPSSIDKLKLLIGQHTIIKNRKDIDAQITRKLETMLTFYKHYLASDTMEHKFLNLWIGLEYVFSLKVGNRSSFKNLLYFYPKIYAVNYTRKIIMDFWNAQLNRKVGMKRKVSSILNTIPSGVRGGGVDEVLKFASIIKKTPILPGDEINKDMIKSVGVHAEYYAKVWEDVIKIEGLDHLAKVKLFRLRTRILANPLETISQQGKRKVFEIRRLYRLRNGLVHRGTSGDLRIDLGMQIATLEDIYVDILELILDSFSHDKKYIQLEGLLMNYETAYLQLTDKNSKNKFWCLPEDMGTLMNSVQFYC